MGQHPTTRNLEKKECHCILCQSKDRDMKEFYLVQIESAIETREPPEKVRDQIRHFCHKG